MYMWYIQVFFSVPHDQHFFLVAIKKITHDIDVAQTTVSRDTCLKNTMLVTMIIKMQSDMVHWEGGDSFFFFSLSLSLLIYSLPYSFICI